MEKSFNNCQIQFSNFISSFKNLKLAQEPVKSNPSPLNSPNDRLPSIKKTIKNHTNSIFSISLFEAKSFV